MKGLFQLQTARDLLAKLGHDYERLRNSPNDAYVAFDFFVTAEHILDWLHPGWQEPTDGRAPVPGCASSGLPPCDWRQTHGS